MRKILSLSNGVDVNSFKNFQAKEQGILNNVIKIIRNSFDPDKIILFGSRAKGNFHKNADFDLAIDKEMVNIRRHRKIMEMINAVTGLYKVDIVYLNSIDKAFKEIILKTGKIIYERRS